jgi:hypothetical protein
MISFTMPSGKKKLPGIQAAFWRPTTPFIFAD